MKLRESVPFNVMPERMKAMNLDASENLAI